ncbi:MAG: ribonuclease J [Rhodothalassiaceae bacterium]
MTFDGLNDSDLFFCPLGGSGEIGMNMNLFACKGEWLMVDCGMTFADDWLPGIDLIFPDPAFIAERRDRLVGLVLTHGHEDHIGAVPWLWRELRCPVYATPFTAELVRGKLEEAGLFGEVPLHVVPTGGTLEAGCFRVRYVPLAHSIPEGHGLLIETPLGKMFHTGDWKLDEDPQIGVPSTPAALAAIGEGGILAMIGDSTNVLNAHASGSEQAVLDSLLEIVGGMTGRVVITTFASNAARLKTVADVAAAHGRKIVPVGRSMRRIIEAARKTGYLPHWEHEAGEGEVASLPRHKTLILCTGAQGEPRAALSRIASGDHRDIALEEGDSVIFSSKIIPGNELALGRLINKLALLDVEVITERDAFVHVSGHPGRAELEKMYGWIKPSLAIPVHGEARHLKAHARFARKLGIPRAIAPTNGDIIRLAPGEPALVDQAPSGRLVLDGNHVVPASSPTVAARRKILSEGFIAAMLLVDEDDESIGDPEIIAIGIPGLEPGSSLEERLIAVAEHAIAGAGGKRGRRDAAIAEAARIAIRRLVRAECDKNPVVDVRVVRLEDEYV